MTNIERMREILKAAEESHIDLYHSVSKDAVEKHIASIKNLDKMSEFEFDGEMTKLFALFQDSHTVYFLPHEPFYRNLRYFKGKIYFEEKGNFDEVKYIGGMTTKQFCAKAEKFIGHETEEFVGVMIDSFLIDRRMLEILGVLRGGKLRVSFKNGQEKLLDGAEGNRVRKSKPEIPYEYKILENDILLVSYHLCFDDPKHPFGEFVKEIEEQVKKNKICKYVLDLRGNVGGNSYVLEPFIKLVKKRKMQGAVLINNETFSSGQTNALDFKMGLGVPLVGEPSSEPVKAYGEIKRIDVCGKRIFVSTHLFDYSDYFGYEGALQPDYYAPITIEDIKNGRDPQLEKAIEILK